MEIDTKIKKIIKDIEEENIDLHNTQEIVEECYTLLRRENRSKKYLDEYVQKIEHLHRVSRFGSDDPTEIRLIQVNLKDILENIRLKTGKYKHKIEGQVVEAMRFEDGLDGTSNIEAFCMPYSLDIRIAYPKILYKWDVYLVKFYRKEGFFYNFLLTKDLDMLLKYEHRIVDKDGNLLEKELLFWTMSVYTFNRFYSRIEENC